MQVLVIGGGVSGLTTAVVLLEVGWEVTVVAREWAPHVVSSVAAAIWHPYQVAHPEATRWATVTAERLRQLMEQPGTGVRMVVGWELHRVPTAPPSWADALPYHQPLPVADLPSGYVCGFVYEVPLIETPVYMQWLHEQARVLGATLETRTIERLADLFEAWPVVVNCTGLGARDLAGDDSMAPIRGQIVKVAAGASERFLFDEDDAERPLYLIPRSDGTIVGGTALRGDWDTAVRPETTEAILARARALAPALAEAEVLDVLVGLRPGRPTVRLEAEWQGSTLLIHNYGHGGAGFTLSWGCAEAVARLAEQRREEPR